MGKWFAANPDKRDGVFLATKFAARFIEGSGVTIDSSPEYAQEACAKSLKRLGLPSVDLYYCHRLDDKTPIEKTVEGMVRLKNEGKIKYLGLSECSAASLRRAHKVHPITAVQIEYSPFALDIESEQIDLLRTARELGVATVAYSPLCRGMLAGALKSPDDFEEGDFRSRAPRFSKENFPKNLEFVERLRDMAEKKGKDVTPSQLVLAWLLAQGQDIFPIPGTTKIERLRENNGSMKVELNEGEVQQIRKLADETEVKGHRYPEAMVNTLFKDSPPL